VIHHLVISSLVHWLIVQFTGTSNANMAHHVIRFGRFRMSLKINTTYAPHISVQP